MVGTNGWCAAAAVVPAAVLLACVRGMEDEEKRADLQYRQWQQSRYGQ
jgi:hypothetical protein